jgi:cell division protein FtsA
MARQAELLVGLDVGSSKVAVVVARQTEEGFALLGTGFAPLVSQGHVALHEGIRRSPVTDPQATTEAIVEAVREAELSSGCSVHSAIVAIGGAHVRGVNSHGAVAVKHGEVRPDDVLRVVDAARAVAFPPDRHVLHVLPQDYVLDDQEGVKDPAGMSGVRLEARVHVVTGDLAAIRNVIRCCEQGGIEVVDVVWAPVPCC